RAAESPEYLRVLLNADSGPFGTRDYRIMLEAVPLDKGRCFIYLSYSYGYGFTAKLALRAYLNTFGSNKVGFTTTGTRSNGEPIYVGDVRGLGERNTMRYYLAIDAYLDAQGAAPPQRLEKRLRNWFLATER